MMNRYVVRDRETGTAIEMTQTWGAAKEIKDRFEEQDKVDEVYEEDFYEIYDLETETVVDEWEYEHSERI